MKKVLVVGASGNMGVSLTNELTDRGIKVVAFARNRKKLELLYSQQPLVSVFSGDGCVPENLVNAAEGVDTIFHSANLPYPEWSEKLPLLMNNVLEAARFSKSKVVVVDNIYAYGKNPGHKVSESDPKQPHTKKGKIRWQLEQTVKTANKEGIPCLIAHFPDFYGPHGDNTLLHVLLDPISRNKRGLFIGNPDIPREYIFLPDAAKALVQLALCPDAYGQNWNIPGPGLITGKEILHIAQQVIQQKPKKIVIGKKSLFLAGLFNPLIRELKEMIYLTEDPVVLDGSKYQREIGPLPKTPYRQGIEETIRFFQNN